MDHFLMIAQQLPDKLALAEVPGNVVRAARQFLDRIRSPVQNRDRSSGGQQFGDQMCADKPGPAYDKSIQFILTGLTFLVEYPSWPTCRRVSGMTAQPPGQFEKNAPRRTRPPLPSPNQAAGDRQQRSEQA